MNDDYTKRLKIRRPDGQVHPLIASVQRKVRAAKTFRFSPGSSRVSVDVYLTTNEVLAVHIERPNGWTVNEWEVKLAHNDRLESRVVSRWVAIHNVCRTCVRHGKKN